MKDNKLNDILRKYTGTEESAKEVNAELKENGYALQLDPKRKEIDLEKIADGTAGYLDDGISMEPVEIVNGELKYAINQVNEDGTTNMKAFVYTLGKKFEVFGTKLVECK